MINKTIKKIINYLLEILDKRETNFLHKFTYISINEVPEEEKVGRMKICNGEEWEDKAVWIGIKNKNYHDVMQLIGKED